MILNNSYIHPHSKSLEKYKNEKFTNSYENYCKLPANNDLTTPAICNIYTYIYDNKINKK